MIKTERILSRKNTEEEENDKSKITNIRLRRNSFQMWNQFSSYTK